MDRCHLQEMSKGDLGPSGPQGYLASVQRPEGKKEWDLWLKFSLLPSSVLSWEFAPSSLGRSPTFAGTYG